MDRGLRGAVEWAIVRLKPANDGFKDSQLRLNGVLVEFQDHQLYSPAYTYRPSRDITEGKGPVVQGKPCLFTANEKEKKHYG